MELEGKRKTAAIVNLKHIKENLVTIKQFVGDKKICAIVKADAYGHGAVEVSKFIIESGLVDYLGVATVEEGCELRDAGIKTPILLLGITFKDQFNLCVKNDFTVTVSSAEDIAELNKIASKHNKLVKTHLIIDTGMGRIGVRQENYKNLAEELLKASNLDFEGIFSHFSDSSNNEYSGIQIQEFKKAVEYFEKAAGKSLVKHMANSGGILNLPESYFDMVRPGIILYGYKPYDNYSKKKIFNPSMTFRTEISFVKYVEKGTVISYGADTFTKEDCYIATIPVGYADGISRSLSDKMQVKINNKIYPQIGRVTMDQTMIILGQDLYSAGTEVLIFDDNSYSVDNYADLMGTIPYEVTCNVSKRVIRYYEK
ncbi:MAG: alanine racemase [Bacteroidetes bacterium]|nr:MAG: alanine racemase [Bacteroidota bacterium]